MEAERAALEAQTRNEGKPEQALPKIVEGKLNGWYKRVPGGVLLEQPYAKDDKQTVAQVLGGAKIVRFAQAVVGADPVFRAAPAHSRLGWSRHPERPEGPPASGPPGPPPGSN